MVIILIDFRKSTVPFTFNNLNFDVLSKNKKYLWDGAQYMYVNEMIILI